MCFALPPIDLGKRYCTKGRTLFHHKNIEWDKQEYHIKGRTIELGPKKMRSLKYVIEEFCKRDISQMEELEKTLFANKTGIGVMHCFGV
jgi:hypothetical protein